MNLLDKLTQNIEPVKEKSDSVEEALKKALTELCTDTNKAWEEKHGKAQAYNAQGT